LEALARFEETGFSIWMRESGVAFFGTLTLHSLAMALVIGINIALNLRLLGFAPRIALPPFRSFFPLHWYGVVAISISGALLLCAYPAKALTNPVFYLKLVSLLSALAIARHFQTSVLQHEVAGDGSARIKMTASLSLILWAITITAGRFLAYTHSVLLASRFY
jgi:hypothetical protein|tara:strand:+ start:3002 stop:3493 length:492 start_codon:yes stop_codon:yes gene_type:complete